MAKTRTALEHTGLLSAGYVTGDLHAETRADVTILQSDGGNWDHEPKNARILQVRLDTTSPTNVDLTGVEVRAIDDTGRGLTVRVTDAAAGELEVPITNAMKRVVIFRDDPEELHDPISLTGTFP